MQDPVSPPILVTGAAGFIGARFVESLVWKGIPAISVDHPNHFQTRAEHVGVNFGHAVGRDGLFEWLERERPKLAGIVHLGACSRTDVTDREFLRRVNVEYGQKLWTWASDHATPFYYASSAATYGGGEQGFSDDEALIPRLKPLNAYGESKQLFDLWALDQARARRAPPAWAGFKFFNVYGFGERHKVGQSSPVLPAYDQIRASGRVKLFRSHREGIADGEQKRDFVFVEDVVRVLHFALEKRVERGIYNLGTGEARTFRALALATFAALGKKPEIEYIDTPERLREHYQYFTQAEMTKLRAAGYARPMTPLEDGVMATVARLKSFNVGSA